MQTVTARISASSWSGATSIPYASRTRNHRFEISATFFHLVADAQLLLLDREQLVAGAALDDEGVADPQCLAVDLEGALAAVCLDPEVVADREHLLPQRVPCPVGAAAVPQPSH
jgi:hypothetical protein